MTEPIYITKPVPTSGINVEQDSILYSEPFSPYMKNAIIDKAVVKKRRGYSLLGFDSTDQPLKGVGMELIEYKDAKGMNHLIALTTTNAYRYNPSTDSWDCIDPSVDLVTTVEVGTNVVLASNFNGDNNATAYTDPIAGAATFLGGAKLSAAQKMQGTASLEIDGESPGGITYPDSDNYHFGTGNFTIDLYVRFRTLSGSQVLISQAASASNYWLISKYDDNKMRVSFISGGVNKGTYDLLYPYNFYVDKWYHIAVVRNATDCLLFIDGKSQHLKTITSFGTNDVGNVAAVLAVGTLFGFGSFNGWIDDLRITKSARWTADFTPNAHFGGSVNNRFSNTLATDMSAFTKNDGTALLISNNVDFIHKFEGESDGRFEVLYTDYGETTPTEELPLAKALAEFHNHLMLMNLQSPDGTIKTVHHATAGDISDIVGEGAGIYLLTDTFGEILRAVKLATSLVIYSERSITMCRYYGGITLFTFQTVLHETGLLSASSVLPTLNLHYFIGTDKKIYVYYGDTQIMNISSKINDMLFSELDISKKNYIAVGHDTDRHKAYFCIPTASDSYANSIYAFNYDKPELSWEYYRFAHSVRSIDIFENYFAWYCDEDPFSTMYCDEAIFYCDEGYGQTDFQMPCFISDNGYVYKMISVDGSDAGEDIEFEVQTPDMTISQEEHFARWQWFSFVAKSDVVDSRCTVLYSTDCGESWTAITDGTVDLDTSWKTHRLPMDVVARKIRFKIHQNSKKDIQLRGLFKCKVVAHKERD